MSIIAELGQVSKSYGRIKALEDVTLKVGSGEMLTLVGPNGAGKTTLLKILACIEKPDGGQLLLNGERVEDKNRQRVKLSTTMVFQKTALFSMSVHENVAYGLRLRKTAKEQVASAVKEALEMVKLEGYEGRMAKKLSGGEQQRVSLARALALNTPLLLLDEPTANLDPKSASIIEEVIRQINKQKGTTVVIATHNIFQAQQIAKRAALLVNGRVTEIGALEDIIRGRGLAGFARLENIFSGTSEIQEEGTSRIRLDDSEMAILAAFRKEGRITVFVRPEDVILSKGKFESSARNIFQGRIVEIYDQGALVRLRVDVGKEFVVQITKKSFSEMGLNMESLVYLTFKASSVQQV